MLSTLSLRAQETHSIYFRFDRSDIDTTFRDNHISTTKLINLVTQPGIMIDSVDIYGYASPDGGHRRNNILSKERAASAKNFILKHSPDSLVLSSSRIRIHAMQENWEGLQKAVEDRYHYLNRNELLKIIHRKGLGVCTRENKIKQLDRGYTWYLLKKEFMADLRTATIITLYTSSYPSFKEYQRAQMMAVEPGLIISQTVRQATQQTDNHVTNQTEHTTTGNSKDAKVFLAFKTNMLYDLAMTPNVGVEFHLGRNWSLGANWAYAWWKHDPKAFYWRLYGGEINIRKYFGKASKTRALSGHHLGIYGQGLTYDLELGNAGILSELSYGGGLEYGYSVPVARTLNIDFSIGAGYLGGEYKVYDPIDDHYVWRETRQRHWFGPTKAEISLVWLIGNKVFRKGGAR